MPYSPNEVKIMLYNLAILCFRGKMVMICTGDTRTQLGLAFGKKYIVYSPGVFANVARGDYGVGFTIVIIAFIYEVSNIF